MFLFSGIDPPEADPLFDLNLRVGRHCYGANLSTAILFVQSDVEVNRHNEDRFLVSGLTLENRAPAGTSAQRAAGSNLLDGLLTTWFPAASKPQIIAVFIPRRYAPQSINGPNVLPPLIFVFSDPKIASQVRAKLISHLRSSPLPAMRRVWLEPILTPATHVRIEILLAMRRVLSSTVIRCAVHRRGRAPQLQVVSGGRERVFGFVPSCELFGHLLTAETLKFAYKAAGRTFLNRLSATFLVLVDGDQPPVNFFIPTPRAARPLPVAGPSVSDNVVDTRVPPPPLLKIICNVR